MPKTHRTIQNSKKLARVSRRGAYQAASKVKALRKAAQAESRTSGQTRPSSPSASSLAAPPLIGPVLVRSLPVES